MEQQKLSVDGWITRQQDGRRHTAHQDRRKTIGQWLTVTVVVAAILVVMVVFGGG